MNLTPDIFAPASKGTRNPWRVKDGLMLDGAGQCLESIHAMQRARGEAFKPALIALYESISGGQYRHNPDVMEAHTLFPGAVLQLGLQLPVFDQPGLLAIANGEWANEIARMAQGYQRLGQPILLRIGYEFDGVKWNGYDPDAYIGAYRVIAKALEKAQAHNVALVWDSYTTDNPGAMDWYPGDDVVDWLGYNTLPPKFTGENRMAALAAEKGKPLMNGEASYSEGVGDMPFENWAQGFFRSMAEAGAQAYQYINWRWQVYPKATNWGEWADGRITDDARKIHAYHDAARPYESCMVFRDESYCQPLMLSIDCARAMTEGMAAQVWTPERDQATAEKGFAYRAAGVQAYYADGWTPHWRGSRIQVELTVPGSFEGLCLIKPAANKAVALCVNGVLMSWEPGHGFLHVPVSGESRIALTIEVQGEAGLSHLFLLKQASTRVKLLSVTPDKLTWAQAEDAALYHVYRDGMLLDVTDQCEYAVDTASHRWAVAPWDAHKGLGQITEARK